MTKAEAVASVLVAVTRLPRAKIIARIERIMFTEIGTKEKLADPNLIEVCDTFLWALSTDGNHPYIIKPGTESRIAPLLTHFSKEHLDSNHRIKTSDSEVLQDE